MKKCIDGICRKKCEIPYSSCNHQNPLRCADGQCVTVIQECASIRCKADTPFLCPDGTCKGTLSHCTYPHSIKIISTVSTTTPESYTASKLHDQLNRVVGIIYTSNQLHLEYKGIGMSKLKKTKLLIDKRYDPLAYMFFSQSLEDIKPVQFIRSVVVSISTNSQSQLIKYKKPIFLNLNIDIMKQPARFNKIIKRVG